MAMKSTTKKKLKIIIRNSIKIYGIFSLERITVYPFKNLFFILLKDFLSKNFLNIEYCKKSYYQNSFQPAA